MATAFPHCCVAGSVKLNGGVATNVSFRTRGRRGLKKLAHVYGGRSGPNNATPGSAARSVRPRAARADAAVDGKLRSQVEELLSLTGAANGKAVQVE